MKSSPYEIGDVLIVTHKGVEQPARVAGYVDSLDDTKPLYVNLRVAGGLRWGERQVKIEPGQVLRIEVDWEKRRQEQWEADLKARAQAYVAKMTPHERAQIHKQAAELGIAEDRRSPLEMMIDRACGIE